jgi:RND family efflux transporter MFP subunit
MQTLTRTSWLSAAVVAVATIASGCGSDAATPAAGATEPVAVQLSPENVATVAETTLTSGPAVSGELTPAREATLRAQVGGSIERLAVEEGQAVRAGQEIARIASRDLDVALESAKAAVSSAETTLGVAESERQRTEALVRGGALAARDLEQARNAVSAAEAQLAAARARQRAAWQQLEDTTIKAPFAGLVSQRSVSLGDVVTPGTAIATVIDPSSLRLEARVPASEIADVRPGAPVRFTVRGFPGQTFSGKVERISPAVDPVTRQVSIFVSLPNVGGKLLAGLFADGRVETTTRTGLAAPVSAIDETGAVPTVTRVRDGKAERVPVTLGARQTERELVEITSGVAAGDVLITGSAKGVATGTAVRVVR